MKITVNIYYKGKNGNARKFAEEMISTGVADKIRAAKGNLRYDYFLPINDKNTVLLIDSWENQQALDLHHSSELMNEIIRLREKYGLKMQVERYVEDEDGIPENDRRYIKTE